MKGNSIEHDSGEIPGKNLDCVRCTSCIHKKVGTNNIISKVQHNKAQQSFQPVEVQC